MKLSKELIEKSKEPFISELENYINSDVELIVKVKSKRLLENKNGKRYLLITFEDKTGILRAIDWFNAEKNNSKVDVGNVVRVNGKIVLYDGRLQLNIPQDSNLIVLNENEYSYERFVSESKIPVDEIISKLFEIIESIRNKELKQLLEEIFKNDEELFNKFKNSPAGLKVHHNYIGGLAEHSITVAKMCDNVAKIYPWLDRDLLITGALLHDIGKIYDYEINSKGIEITQTGELIGHIVMGYEIVNEKIKKLNLRGISEKLLHMILSHHGELEWGSPILPKTPEAFVLHMIENLDSKLNRIQNIKEKELETNPNKKWSDFDPNLGRRLLLKHTERG
ncbi:phosphohydrolase [Thermosipho affectus]|uniref:Phosphohydrolase n=1 Tax=Thermosipho affectus TaxID=660294 RepID=A0ABX3IHI1_9BACT|nr:HD domain-containing protein [Thermosipho affectus]ONN27291.1 phosphohydrolase [Thermosipho affectus]